MTASSAHARDKKVNILLIFGDDAGQAKYQPFCPWRDGVRNPNIHRIGQEGMTFTDCYAENSCTTGRSSVITGQSPIRISLSKVGMPGAPLGLQKRHITIAETLKQLGYPTRQFGKNHLGDRDKYLPANHGFDEFFGNLYHLNMEQEPEMPDWPKDDSRFAKVYAPRGVIHAADGSVEDTI